MTAVNWHIVMVSQSSKLHFCSETIFRSFPTQITCFDLLSKWQNPSRATGRIVVLAQGATFKEASQARPPLPVPLCTLARKQFQIHWLWSSLQDPSLYVCCLLATPCEVALISCHHCLPPGKGNLIRGGEIFSIEGGGVLPLSIAQTWQSTSRFSGHDFKFSNVGLHDACFYAEICATFCDTFYSVNAVYYSKFVFYILNKRYKLTTQKS